MNYSSLFETIDGDFDTLNNDELFDLSLSDKLTEMTTLTNSSKSSHSNLNHIDQTTLNSRQIDHLNLLSLSNELAKFYHWNSLPSPEYIHNSFNFSFSPSPRQSIAHDRNSSIVPTDYIVQDSSSVPNDSTLGNNFLQMDSSLAPAMPPTMNPTMANSIAPSMGASLAPAMVSDTVNPTMASNINGDLNTSRAGSNGCVGPDSSMEQTINPRQLFSIIPQSVSSPALSTLFNSKQKMSVPKLPDQSKVQFDLNDKINFKMNDMNNWYGINMNWDMEENKANRMNNNFNDNCDINNIPINDQLFLNENDLNAANSSSLQQPLHMPLPTIRQGRSQSMSSPVISGMNPQLRRNSIATPEIGKRKRRKSNEISSNKGNSPINHGHSRGSSITSLPKSYSNTSIKENISSTSTAVLNNQISPLTNNFNAQFPDAGSSNSSSSSNVAGYPLVVTSFPCTECDKQFKRSEHLKRHIRSVHSNIRPFHCKYCEKKFSRSDNLAQHLKTHYRTDANGNPTIIYGNPNNQRKSKK